MCVANRNRKWILCVCLRFVWKHIKGRGERSSVFYWTTFFKTKQQQLEEESCVLLPCAYASSIAFAPSDLRTARRSFQPSPKKTRQTGFLCTPFAYRSMLWKCCQCAVFATMLIVCLRSAAAVTLCGLSGSEGKCLREGFHIRYRQFMIVVWCVKRSSIFVLVAFISWAFAV